MTTRLASAATRLMPVLAAAWLAAACDVTIGLDAARFVDREKKDFQVSGTPDLVLSTFDGSIEIRAWDRPEVSVEIEKRGADKRATDQIEVKATQSGNQISVEVRAPEQGRPHIGFNRSRSARLIVSVPIQTNLDARTGDLIWEYHVGADIAPRVTGCLLVERIQHCRIGRIGIVA